MSDFPHGPYHRLISDLSNHEKGELDMDYGFNLSDRYVVAILTKEQWENIISGKEND